MNFFLRKSKQKFLLGFFSKIMKKLFDKISRKINIYNIFLKNIFENPNKYQKIWKLFFQNFFSANKRIYNSSTTLLNYGWCRDSMGDDNDGLSTSSRHLLPLTFISIIIRGTHLNNLLLSIADVYFSTIIPWLIGGLFSQAIPS